MLALSSKLLFTVNSLTILGLGIIASFLFSYILKNSETSQKVSVHYFTLHFALLTVAFFTVLTRFFGFEAFSTLANNILYTIAIHSLIHGIAYRDGNHKKMLHNKWVYINVAFIVIVNFVIFYIIYDNLKIRATIIQTNISLIALTYLFSSPKYRKKLIKPADILLRRMLIIMPFINISILSLIVFDRFDLYHVYGSASQILQGFAWAMVLAVVLMLDMSEMHYKDSITDKLSGLYNRRYFEQEVSRLISLTPHKSYAMMICDIDNFKTINDTYGHHIGDLVIQKVSFNIKEVLSDDYLVCRFGGEEFMIFCCPEDLGKSQDEIAEKAKVLLEKIAQSPVIVDGKTISFTVSLGLTCCKISVEYQQSHTNNDLSESCAYYFKQADQALYQAKNSGKNKVCIA